MGRLAWSGLALCGALVTAACGNETAIVVEVSLSPALAAQLEESGGDFETLRIWVGHPTENPAVFTGSADAYFTTAMRRHDLAVPFRYLLEPGADDVATIGPMMLAAGVGTEPADARLPFRLAGFAAATSSVSFAAGEIRVVPLVLGPPAGAQGTIGDACIIWGLDTQRPQRISASDDLDCDGAVGADDCDDLDPRLNHLDVDGDGVSSCDGDCMDIPDDRVPWLDPALVHPGATDPGGSHECSHIDWGCAGRCGDAARDGDGSGSTECGRVTASHGVCEVLPADCDEALAGNQVDPEGAAEACNGKDDACDGFLPPPLPCMIPGGAAGECFFGEVKCDELRGEYASVAGALECKRLPGPLSDFTAPPLLCGSAPSESCQRSDDPVACAFPTSSFARADCTVSLSPTSEPCLPNRIALALPGIQLPASCAWHVVGGSRQAEWEIGFVDANAADDATPMPSVTACAPHLAVRSHVRRPADRTVLLLFVSPENPLLGARPLLVHLSGEDNGQLCSRDLACVFSATPE